MHKSEANILAARAFWWKQIFIYLRLYNIYIIFYYFYLDFDKYIVVEVLEMFLSDGRLLVNHDVASKGRDINYTVMKPSARMTTRPILDDTSTAE